MTASNQPGPLHTGVALTIDSFMFGGLDKEPKQLKAFRDVNESLACRHRDWQGNQNPVATSYLTTLASVLACFDVATKQLKEWAETENLADVLCLVVDATRLSAAYHTELLGLSNNARRH